MSWHRQRGAPVDVHVLVHHGSFLHPWLERCLASLECEPVNVLLVVEPGSDNIGGLRSEAYALGSAPFVSAVDDDDWVEPGAFDACMQAMGNAVGSFTDMTCVDVDGVEISRTVRPAWEPKVHVTAPAQVLHLRVMKRVIVERCLSRLPAWPVLDCLALNAMVAHFGRWQKVDCIGYHKTLHDDGAHQRHVFHDWHRLNVLARMELKHGLS